MKKVWTLLAVIMVILGITYNLFDLKSQDKENVNLYSIIKDMQIDNSSGQNVDNIKNTQTGPVDKLVKEPNENNDFKDEVVKHEDKKEIKEKEDKSVESIENADESVEYKDVISEEIKKEETKDKVNEEVVEENNENIVEEEKVVTKKIDEQEKNDDVVESLAISQDLISSVENSLLLADEVEAVKLILSKLSPSEINMLKDMIDGGLTEEEKEKVIELACSRFSEKEINFINELYDKYLK